MVDFTVRTKCTICTPLPLNSMLHIMYITLHFHGHISPQLLVFWRVSPPISLALFSSISIFFSFCNCYCLAGRREHVAPPWWTIAASIWPTTEINDDILNQDDLKKRMNRITDSWRNGCFQKMADHRRCCFAQAILHQDDLKKRINRITATW